MESDTLLSLAFPLHGLEYLKVKAHYLFDSSISELEKNIYFNKMLLIFAENSMYINNFV